MKDPNLVPPTLVDAVNELARTSSLGFTFVRSDGSERHVPFPELREEARRRAAHFAARGLSKGDRLAIVVPDPDEFVLSFLGAIFAGVVPVPMVPQLSFKNVETYHDTVAHIAKASGAKLLLTTESTRPYVEPAAQRVDSLGGILTTSDLAGPMAGEVDAKVTGDDLCFLQFTSGSTSKPKGVVVTHRNLAWNSQSFMVNGLEKDSSFDKGVSWLPLFHDMGLIGFVHRHARLRTSRPCSFRPRASRAKESEDLARDDLEVHRGTITYAPNFAYQLVSKRVKEKDVEKRRISRRMLPRRGCGAEPIQARRRSASSPTKLAPAKLRSDGAPSRRYGMAESHARHHLPRRSARRSSLRSHRPERAMQRRRTPSPRPTRRRPCSRSSNCGRGRSRSHEVAIVDEAGQRAARSVSVGRDRAARAERLRRATSKSEEAHERSAFKRRLAAERATSAISVDGEVFVCGRVKDLIIIRGRELLPAGSSSGSW
jgi:fatty-acyl-CoA synthase